MRITKQQSVRATESGNVLFLILIAVALFAALSYAVTQSSRSGGGDANSEKSLVSSSQLTQYPAGIRTAIVRMIVSNGVSVDQLLFDDPSNFANLSTDPLKRTGVFYPTLGGGATYSTAPAEIMASGAFGTWVFSSKYQVKNVGITAADGSGNEIIAFLSGVTKALCIKMDNQLGITATADAPTGELAAAVPLTDNMDFTHQGIPGSATATIGSTASSPFLGQPFGCMKATDGTYIYYHVLVER